MTRIEKSDAQLDAEASREIHKCQTCGRDYLDGYPHHHATEPRAGYDPMPPRPPSVLGMIAVIRREYRLEIPPRLHVSYVPGRTEPIGVSEYSAAAAGYVAGTAGIVDALDTGPLGSPPWSPTFHRRVGAVTHWEGAQTIEESDWMIFPWALAIERRLDRWCRSKHGNRPELWREHRGEVICPPLVELVIKRDRSIAEAAAQFDMTPERAEEVLDDALRRVWGQVSNVLNRLPVAA